MTDEELQAKAPALASTHKLRERVEELEAMNAELLEALDLARDVLWSQMNPEKDNHLRPVWDRLDAALRKAEGSTE